MNAIYLSRHSLRECGVKLENLRVLLEIHVLLEIQVSFAERTTTMVSNADGIGRKPGLLKLCYCD